MGDPNDVKTADMADAPPVIETRRSDPRTVNLEEIELVKIVLSTSVGHPIVVAVTPELTTNDILEVIAWLAANNNGFRDSFIAAMQARQAPLVDVSRGKLKS